MNRFRTPCLAHIFHEGTTDVLVSAILKHAKKNQSKLFWEIIYNMLHGNIDLSSSQLRKLKQQKTAIDLLLKNKDPVAKLTRNVKLLKLFLTILRPWYKNEILQEGKGYSGRTVPEDDKEFSSDE